MKVALHVGQLLQPVPGGIGAYTRALVRELPSDELLTFAAGPAPDGCAAAKHTDLGFPRGSLRYQLWNRWQRPRLHIAADIVHAPSLAIPPARNVPLVVTVHDVAFIKYPETFTRAGRAFHTRGLELARKHAAAIITDSQATKNDLIQEGFDASHIYVIPLGCDTPQIPPNAIELVNKLGVREPYVLAVGTIEPRKGLDTLLDAVALVRRDNPELTVVLAGQEGWLHVEGLERSFVTPVGFVRPETLSALYARAVACAVPSLYEGFGLPALESMAHGCPVIAANNSSLPEVVGNAGILVQTRDVDAWAEAIGSIVNDQTMQKDLHERGLTQAAAFTWSQCADAHQEVYQRVAQAPRHPSEGWEQPN